MRERTPVINPHADGCAVRVWVVPRASRTEIVGRHGDALRVRVADAPEAGKANVAVAKLLAQHTGALSAFVVGGLRSRRKTVVLVGVDVEAAISALLG